MAGIYIHIPFCKQACYYCDFHFSSYLALKDELIDALVQELEWQKDFFNTPVETIYFGGGTPSLLNAGDLEKIFSVIYKNYTLIQHPEITLEANPDDMSPDNLKTWAGFKVNRLSMGIQSFDDKILRYLNRLHTSDEAIKSYYQARSLGFENINCDLIFAIPGQSTDVLQKDLAMMMELQPEHISAYCLTIEERTVFGNWLKKKKFTQVEEENAVEQMEEVWDFLIERGYEQYEISNFCRNNLYSKHNSSYWKDKVYLGVGPGAHSYDGLNRFFNIHNNNLYIKSMKQGKIPLSWNNLTLEDRINEYVLTSLRTKWGCDLNYVNETHGRNLMREKTTAIEILCKDNLIQNEENILLLTKQGKLLADFVSSKLFI